MLAYRFMLLRQCFTGHTASISPRQAYCYNMAFSRTLLAHWLTLQRNIIASFGTLLHFALTVTCHAMPDARNNNNV